ncbi:glycosyltransferase family 2 protein, partial [Patescibacteria group bacterium]|nr:glycosyltransferase family 2 protein [Patescibacteria group bacterium]
MKKYSFVVLTYNSQGTIDGCLNSIIEKTAKQNIETEIIVVDNASKDDSADYVEKNFSDKGVKVIRNTKNSGFSGGVNIGLQAATGDYCVLLNPDASIETIDFSKVQETFDNNKVGILSGKIIWPGGRTQPSFGFFPTRAKLLSYYFKLANIWPGGFLVHDNFWNHKYYQQLSTVGWVSGCFMIIPKQVLAEVKYFDEEYFLYIEDTDLCYRISQKGYKIMVDPQIVISHLLQYSVKKDPLKNFHFEIESMIRFFRVHYNQNVTGFMNRVYKLKKWRLDQKNKSSG